MASMGMLLTKLVLNIPGSTGECFSNTTAPDPELDFQLTDKYIFCFWNHGKCNDIALCCISHWFLSNGTVLANCLVVSMIYGYDTKWCQTVMGSIAWLSARECLYIVVECRWLAIVKVKHKSDFYVIIKLLIHSAYHSIIKPYIVKHYKIGHCIMR